MTDTYSIENYLVTDGVLDALLRDEFPCHARPDLRQAIIEIFNKDYDDFLQITTAINKRLYIARLVPIALTKDLPTSLGKLAAVSVGRVNSVATPPEEIVSYEREPIADETVGLAEAFDHLEPRLRYRGKFAIKFFGVWLNKLADEYVANDREVFGKIKPEGAIRRAEFVLSNFASKSRIPTNFPAFIDAIA